MLCFEGEWRFFRVLTRNPAYLSCEFGVRMVVATETLEYVATIGIQSVCRSSDCCGFVISFTRESYAEMREVQIWVMERSAKKMCTEK